jgi:cytochrome c-type biogenesis protein
MSPRARLRASSWFALGFGVVFTLLGLGVSLLVDVVRPLRPLVVGGAATMLVLYGLRMMGLLDTSRRLAWMERTFAAGSSRSRIGVPRPFMLGMIFALTWTPCAGPVLGGVLTYVATERERAMVGALMLLVYSAGIAAPLILIAVATEYVTPLLRRLGKYVRLLERATGAAVTALGVFVLLNMPAVSSAPGGGVTPSSEHDAERSEASGMAQLVFFHSEHCPMCRAMEKELPALEHDCEPDRWKLVPIDVDQTENAAMLDRFNVHVVPTMSLVDARGREALHLVGYQSPDRLRQALEREIEIACTGADVPPPADDGPVEGRACDVGKAC